jgi:flagellar protein FliS
VEAVGSARRHLRDGDIPARGRQISKVIAILNELALSLDHEAGGEISRGLAELYDYLQRLILKANFEQIETPLVEAEQLLTTMLDAWENCRSSSEEDSPSGDVSEHVAVSCSY